MSLHIEGKTYPQPLRTLPKKILWCVFGYPGRKLLQSFTDQLAAQVAMLIDPELHHLANAFETWKLEACKESEHVSASRDSKLSATQ